MQTEQEISYEAFYKNKFDAFVAYCCANFAINEQDAEDIVSETFDVMWRNWEEITPHTAKSLSLWMYSAMFKKQQNLFRLRRKKQISYDDYITTHRAEIEMVTYIDVVEEKDEYELFIKYLTDISARLSGADARLFHMIVIENRSAEYIAKELNCKPQNTYLKWHRLRRKLRKILSELKILKNF